MPDDPDDAPIYAILDAPGGIGSDVSRRFAAGGAQLVLGPAPKTRSTCSSPPM